MEKHYIVLQRPVTIHGQDFKPNTVLASLDVPPGVPPKRAIAAIANGSAKLTDREPAVEPTESGDANSTHGQENEA